MNTHENIPGIRKPGILDHLKIEYSEIHRALPDCMITFQLYKKLNEIS